MPDHHGLAEIARPVGVRAEEVLHCKLLIVEDDLITRAVLVKLLKKEGFEYIEEAENGQEAMVRVKSFRPDLVIADIKMPVMDGFELCRTIRHDPDPDIARTPILIQTALKHMKDKARVFEAGATDYVAKPIDPGEVAARCIVHLEREIILRRLHRFNTNLARERSPQLPADAGDREEEFWSLKRLSATVAALLDEIERGHTELKHAMQRMEQADQLKIEFLNNVTRELKVPVRSIIESAQLAAGDCDRGKITAIKRHTADIYTHGHRLEVLIGDLLDFSQLETGNITTRIECHAVREVLDRAIAFLHRHADNKRLSIVIEASAAPTYVMVDATRIEQVFITLIRNAIQFSPPAGRIVCRIAPARMSMSETHDIAVDAVMISIEDEGPGIAKFKLEELFDPFVQGRGIYEGTGLGLAICRRLLRLFHGTIDAGNGVRGGGRFDVTLPLAQD